MKKTVILTGLIWYIAALLPSNAQSLHTVSILDGSFSPASVTVSTGDTVRWVMNSTIAHTVTSGSNCTSNGVFNSGTMSSGQSFSFVFTQSGSFPYYCIPHCSQGMAGVITVEGTTGISGISSPNHSLIADLHLYPNPTNNNAFLTFELLKPAHISLEAMDIAGRKLKSIANQEFTSGNHEVGFTTESLSPGIYFINLKINNDTQWVEKLIKH
jgi:plastocyanin